MAALLIQALLLLLSLTIFVSLSLTSAITSTTTKPTDELRIKLIHRDSIHSPYYNPNATLEESAQHAVNQTIARSTYLQGISRRNLLDDDGKRAYLVRNNEGSLFLAQIAIGQPPVPQLVIIDTSTSLLWVQCEPCPQCFPQTTPMFDPSKSSTYLNVPCTSMRCSDIPGSICDSNGEYCLYKTRNFDGTVIKGNYAHEQLVLNTSDGGDVTLDIFLGCTHVNTGSSFDGQVSGVLGLGPNNLLLGQQGDKFSYCLGDINDPNYSFTHLIIGKGAKLIGYKTPIEVYNGLYYLSMYDISVGGKLLDDIDSTIFQRTPSGDNGVIIDTGTPFLWLNKAAFIPYRDEIRRLLRGRFTEVNHLTNPSMVCFGGNMHEDLNDFPEVTFHFQPGEDFSFDYRSIFFPLGPETFCLAALQSDDHNGLSVIGTWAQQFFNIAYDITAKELHFVRVDNCLRFQ